METHPYLGEFETRGWVDSQSPARALQVSWVDYVGEGTSRQGSHPRRYLYLGEFRRFVVACRDMRRGLSCMTMMHTITPRLRSHWELWFCGWVCPTRITYSQHELGATPRLACFFSTSQQSVERFFACSNQRSAWRCRSLAVLEARVRNQGRSVTLSRGRAKSSQGGSSVIGSLWCYSGCIRQFHQRSDGSKNDSKVCSAGANGGDPTATVGLLQLQLHAQGPVAWSWQRG